MLSKELRKKIELIRLTAGKKVTESFTGNYESAFKGEGIEFDEVKEYVAGDDYRFIDWNVTARTGAPHIKRYIEERELSILFAVDISASSGFQSYGKSKLDMMAQIVAALALAAAKSNDKTGLMLFSDHVVKFIPPQKGAQHNIRLIEEIMSIKANNEGTNIEQAITYLCEITQKHWTVFLISDFYDFNSNWLKLFRSALGQFDIVPILPKMMADTKLPSGAIIKLEDPETKKSIYIDCSSKKIREEFEKKYQSYHKRLQRDFLSCATRLLCIDMDKDWVNQLITFFYQRELKRGRG